MNGAFGVQRLDLYSGARDQAFTLGTNEMYMAQDLEFLLGSASTVVASLSAYDWMDGYPNDVAFYDDATPLSAKGGEARGLTLAADGSCVFGSVPYYGSWQFVRMWPGPGGL